MKNLLKAALVFGLGVNMLTWNSEGGVADKLPPLSSIVAGGVAVKQNQIRLVQEAVGKNRWLLDTLITKLGHTVLHLCAATGEPEMLKCLLRLGANARIKNKTGLLPLHMAATYGTLTALQLLIDYTLDRPLPRTDGGVTVAMCVAAHGIKEMLDILCAIDDLMYSFGLLWSGKLYRI